MKESKVTLPDIVDSLIEAILGNSFGYRFWIKLFNRQFQNAIITILPPLNTSSRVLDVGCGPGLNSGIFVNCVYLGIDINERYVKTAQKLHPGKKFEVQDIRALESGPLFDVVLISTVLHHLSDSETKTLLASVYNLLDHSGILIVQEPSIPPRTDWFARICMKLDRGKFIRSLANWQKVFIESGFIIDKQIFYKLKLLSLVCTNHVFVARLVRDKQ
jgi:SAM-dependent methyltransferase